jgi:hypothetical protein
MVIDHRTRVLMNSKRRVHVPSVKPLGTPLLDRINQVIIKKQTFFALVKLNLTTTQRRSTVSLGVWFQAKEIAKQGNRRKDSKESLKKMNKP